MRQEILGATFTIRASECNGLHQTRLASLFQVMQEMAWKHAFDLGIGQQIHEQGLLWVLSGMRIQALRMPSWQEEIHIETWPRGLSGPYAVRDFRIMDKEGQLILRACSTWLILMQKDKRPIRIDQHFPAFPKVSPKEADLLDLPIKLKQGKGALRPLAMREVQYSELDLYNHMNNASFVRYWEDAYFKERKLAVVAPFIFDIQYKAEVFAGEFLQIDAFDDGFFSIRRGEERVCLIQISS
jgi:acyl-ACP thioesterase